jgi:hypothetical protein
MKRSKLPGTKVFISPNSDGQLVITDAEAHRKALEQIMGEAKEADWNSDRLAEYLTKVLEDDGKIDSRGRLRLPSVFVDSLRGKQSSAFRFGTSPFAPP